MAEPPYLMSRPNVTARALVEYKGRFLLLYAPWCERWTLPGGRIEGAERVEDTVRRELLEEIGVAPRRVTFVGFGQGAQYGKEIACAPPKVHLIFHAPITKEPVINQEEARDAVWVTFAQLKRQKDLESGIDDFLRRFPNPIPRL